MNKTTFSHYGSIIAVVIILAIMVAFATPFGNYVADSSNQLISSFTGKSNASLSEANSRDYKFRPLLVSRIVSATNQSGDPLTYDALDMSSASLINSLVAFTSGDVNELNVRNAQLLDVTVEGEYTSATITFDVGDLANEGDEIGVYHYNESTSSWEHIGNYVTSAELQITATFASLSPVALINLTKDYTVVDDNIIINPHDPMPDPNDENNPRDPTTPIINPFDPMPDPNAEDAPLGELTDLTGTKWLLKKPSEFDENSFPTTATTYSINYSMSYDTYSGANQTTFGYLKRIIGDTYQIQCGSPTSFSQFPTFSFAKLFSNNVASGYSVYVPTESENENLGDVRVLMTITGGDDATNTNLIAWVNANATRLPATDLTNTTWTFKDTGIESYGSGSNTPVNLNGSVNDTNIISFYSPAYQYSVRMTTVLFATGDYYIYYLAEGDYLYPNASDGEGWYLRADGAYTKLTTPPTITITGGTDVTNTDLIAWLNANTTQLPVADLTNTTWLLKKPSEWDVTTFPDQSTTYSLNYSMSYDTYTSASQTNIVINYRNNIAMLGNTTHIYPLIIGYKTNVNGSMGYRTSESDAVTIGDVRVLMTITGGTDVTNTDLIAWVNANATQLPVTDLTGTTWTFKDTGIVPYNTSEDNSENTINVNFPLISGEGTATRIVSAVYSVGSGFGHTVQLGSLNQGLIVNGVYLRTTDGVYTSYSLTDGEGWYIYDNNLSTFTKITTPPTITITGGTDVTNTAVIAYFAENAEMQVNGSNN